jgi:hypothetical protein
VLVSAIDRAVETMPFVVHIGLQGAKQPSPLAALRPAIEPIEDGLPWAKLRWQVAPRHSSPSPPEHRFDEVPIIRAALSHFVVGFYRTRLFSPKTDR